MEPKLKNVAADPEAFRVHIEGFSGPLDLLCHMVEFKEIEAANIKVSEVISLYGVYLARIGNLPIAALAEFIAQAAHLVLQKTLALLPRLQSAPDDFGLDDGEIFQDEEPDLETLLERYRPYRKAASLLEQLKHSADRRRFRPSDPMPPIFDLGDLYSLSSQWLELLGRRRSFSNEEDWDSWEMEGVPPAIPDEIQVETRMERILERLSLFHQGLSMRALLQDEPGRSAVVVTLLALLELSRRDQVKLSQKEMFGDVLIICGQSA